MSQGNCWPSKHPTHSRKTVVGKRRGECRRAGDRLSIAGKCSMYHLQDKEWRQGTPSGILYSACTKDYKCSNVRLHDQSPPSLPSSLPRTPPHPLRRILCKQPGAIPAPTILQQAVRCTVCAHITLVRTLGVFRIDGREACANQFLLHTMLKEHFFLLLAALKVPLFSQQCLFPSLRLWTSTKIRGFAEAERGRKRERGQTERSQTRTFAVFAQFAKEKKREKKGRNGKAAKDDLSSIASRSLQLCIVLVPSEDPHSEGGENGFLCNISVA